MVRNLTKFTIILILLYSLGNQIFWKPQCGSYEQSINGLYNTPCKQAKTCPETTTISLLGIALHMLNTYWHDCSHLQSFEAAVAVSPLGTRGCHRMFLTKESHFVMRSSSLMLRLPSAAIGDLKRGTYKNLQTKSCTTVQSPRFVIKIWTRVQQPI
jgi:hypothetical protein